MPEALKLSNTWELDVVGVIEIVSSSYLLGNRTLVKGIKKFPWMTSFETLNREYSLINELPQHKKVNIDMNIFTINFKQKLKKEMKKYIADKKV